MYEAKVQRIAYRKKGVFEKYYTPRWTGDFQNEGESRGRLNCVSECQFLHIAYCEI